MRNEGPLPGGSLEDAILAISPAPRPAPLLRIACCVLASSLAVPVGARADEPAATSPPPGAPAPVYETVVTATTPLHGSRLPRDRIPANVQTATAQAIADQRSLDLSAYLNDALGSVHVNDVQGNPLQPDLQYRGFVASPVLGAPQGLSTYLDGARLNEPFGDTVNWDLIPTNAIRSVNLMPGSNPLFGLNTLGGALSLETKTGFTDAGAAASLLYGSFGRKMVRANGGWHGDRFGVFAAAQLFDEDGWRAFSPSRSADALLSTSYEGGASTAELVLLGVDTRLTGNAASPEQLVAVDRAAVFTFPDRTENRLFMALARGERPLAAQARISGTAYLRESRTRSLNGDQRDWSACAAQPGVLCSIDHAGAELPVLDRAGTPVPFAGSYDAANNSSYTRQHGYGAAAQIALERPLGGRENHLFVGAAADQGRIRFRSQSTVATLTAQRGTLDAGFVDPASTVAVDSVVSSLGAYASDTLALRRDLFLTLSGRFNISALTLADQLGASLSGDHRFQRLNPALGVSYQPRVEIGAYAGYSESARAPTAVELTCASPTAPCRLPNAFVADPALAQVVARTLEVGVRGGYRRGRATLDYALAGFRTTNSDDILFVSSGTVANQGYFSNVGDTRRQGIEASLQGRQRLGAQARVDWTLRYTMMNATFETPFTALSATHPDAVNGSIAVAAGAHLPGVPTHVGKAGIAWTSSFGLSAGANVIANSGQYLRGDEANRLAPLAGFVVVSLRVAYQIARPLSVALLVNNAFDARYATFGVLGSATEVLGAGYDSPRFIGPGAPRAAWLEVAVRY
jgi:iron complex outermembrane receptor protein